jgi:hypothetical protein
LKDTGLISDADWFKDADLFKYVGWFNDTDWLKDAGWISDAGWFKDAGWFNDADWFNDTESDSFFKAWNDKEYEIVIINKFNISITEPANKYLLKVRNWTAAETPTTHPTHQSTTRHSTRFLVTNNRYDVLVLMARHRSKLMNVRVPSDKPPRQ